jgi:hypothetical protein
MTVDMRTYWARRAKDEVERARAASDPRVAERHRKLAQLYLERSVLHEAENADAPNRDSIN